MLEMAFAAVFVTVALVAIGGRHVATDKSVALGYTPLEEATDLPCPWCSAITREADAHCPSCGQPFG
jgi:predicted RNA-binding Zn-ribbon protein involved in translation (DUF1610 family)